jgi:hypothetical protein
MAVFNKICLARGNFPEGDFAGARTYDALIGEPVVMCCWKNIHLLFLAIAFSVCAISCTSPNKQKVADSASHQQPTTISYEKNGTESDAVWQFTREFYEWYVPAASEKKFTDLLDAKEMRRAIAPELLQALKEDSRAQKQDTTGNIVGLDFDPFLASQDPCEKYIVGKINPKGKSYWAEIHGVGGCAQHDSPDLFAEIAKTNKSWIISNYHYPKPATDLLNILADMNVAQDKKGLQQEQRSFSSDDPDEVFIRKPIKLPDEAIQTLRTSEAGSECLRQERKFDATWVIGSEVHLGNAGDTAIVVMPKFFKDSNPNICMKGAANNTFWVLQKGNNGYQLLLETMALGLGLEESRHNGYLDITTYVHINVSETATVYYRFDGRRYQEFKQKITKR